MAKTNDTKTSFTSSLGKAIAQSLKKSPPPSSHTTNPSAPTSQTVPTSTPQTTTTNALNRSPETLPSDPASARALTRTQSDAAASLTGGRLGKQSFAGVTAATARSNSDSEGTFGGALIDAVTESIERQLDPSSVHNQAPEGEPETTRTVRGGATINTYEDGTTVTEWESDGVEHTSVRTVADDGTVRTTHTHTEDGVEITESIIRQPDGTRRVVSDRAADGTVERSDVTTEPVEGELLDLIPRGEFAHTDTDGPLTGERVTTRQGVYDTTTDPPTYRPVSQSESVSVDLPTQHEDGDRFEFDDPLTPGGAEAVELNRDIDVDQHQSGRTLTHEVRTNYDEEGEAQPEITTLSSETRVIGTDEQGRRVNLNHQSVEIHQDGEGTTGYAVSDYRGAFTADELRTNGRLSDLEDYPEYAERIDDGGNGYVDLRTTTVRGQTHRTEIGNYADPTADGQTVVLQRDRDQGESVSLRNVYNDGRNVDEQTVYPGTELTTVSRSRFEDDGSYISESEVLNSGEPITREVREGRVVERYQVSREVDGDARDLFLESAEGELVEETVRTTSYDEEGNATTQEALNYRASDSDANLQFIDGPDGQLSVASDGENIYAVDQDGLTLETDGNGRFLVDGELVRDDNGQAFAVPGLLSRPRSGVSAINRLFKAAQERGIRNNPFPESFQKKVSAVGGAFAAVNVGAELLSGDLVGALEDTAGGAVSLVGGAKLLGVSEAALRRLNVAGAVLNGGFALRDLVNGDYLDAGLKAGTAGGLLLVAAGGALTGPLGLALLGGIGIFEIGRFIFSNRDQAELPPLQI